MLNGVSIFGYPAQEPPEGGSPWSEPRKAASPTHPFLRKGEAMLACGKRLPPPATPSFKVEKTEKIKKNRGKTLLNFLFSREAIYLSRGRGPAALGRGEVKSSATALASGFGRKIIKALD